jgi:hypothetical protein
MQITALIGVMVGQSFFIIMAENFPLFETKLKSIEKLSTLTSLSRVLPERLTGPQLVKKFPAFYITPKVLYRIHKHQSHVPILNHINPFHASTSHLLNMCFNIIIPFVPLSSKWSLSLRFPHQNTILKICWKCAGANSQKAEG